MKILIAFLLMVSANAFADRIYIGGWSHHLNDYPGFDEGEYNETHNLIGYERKGYMVGHYKNSFNQSTVVAVKNFESQHNDIAVFISVGATRGYGDCEKRETVNDKKICAHYQAGFAYTKYRVQPVFSISTTVTFLTFRVDI